MPSFFSNDLRLITMRLKKWNLAILFQSFKHIFGILKICSLWQLCDLSSLLVSPCCESEYLWSKAQFCFLRVQELLTSRQFEIKVSSAHLKREKSKIQRVILEDVFELLFQVLTNAFPLLFYRIRNKFTSYIFTWAKIMQCPEF